MKRSKSNGNKGNGISKKSKKEECTVTLKPYRQQSVLKHSDDSVDVLCQKMGDRWFAFSLIDDEVFVGSVPSSELDSIDSSDKGKSSDN